MSRAPVNTAAFLGLSVLLALCVGLLVAADASWWVVVLVVAVYVACVAALRQRQPRRSS